MVRMKRDCRLSTVLHLFRTHPSTTSLHTGRTYPSATGVQIGRTDVSSTSLTHSVSNLQTNRVYLINTGWTFLSNSPLPLRRKIVLITFIRYNLQVLFTVYICTSLYSHHNSQKYSFLDITIHVDETPPDN
jgi:hypothetical protein